MTNKLSALQYIGNKSYRNLSGSGKWINSLLPEKDLYVEPFAGMLGILLQRDPAKFEIINDLDNNVTNWWRCVRDEPKELSRLIDLTPKSRIEHLWALNNVNNMEETPVRRALAFTILINQSFASVKYRWYTHKKSHAKDWRKGISERILQLTDRMSNVQIEQKNASLLLEEIAKYDDAIIYCDPPYRDATDKKLYEKSINIPELTETLKQQKGLVAISGYNDEWDHLNWQRHEYDTFSLLSGKPTKRAEILWTNYNAEE